MQVQLRSQVSPADMEARAGSQLVASDLAIRLEGNADLYRPDGAPLLLLRRGALSGPALTRAYPALHSLRKTKTTNRGAYSGSERYFPVFQDGTKSKNGYTLNAVASAIVGYFGRQGGRFPFCRATRFTAQEVEAWGTVVPLLKQAALLFAKVAPERYTRQLLFASNIHNSYVIEGTPFTTVTVNNNVAPSGIHTDKGDFKDGLGMIACLRMGEYTGGDLVFPQYKVGVNLGDGDVVFFNSHDWHGVMPMEKLSEDAERITLVLYLRTDMADCLAPEQELARAREKYGKLEDEDASSDG